MTAADLSLVDTKPEAPRDRWGRYLIPGPDNKTPMAYTRATTIAKTLADNFGLEAWKCRQVARGIGLRPDLYKLAVSHDPDTDRKVYEEIVENAMEAAESATGRRAGTALHRMTELADLGKIDYGILPADDATKVKLYRDKLDEAGIQVHPQWIEQVFVHDPFSVAGTADRIVTLADGRRVIFDLKTSKDVKFGALEFAIQLAIYSAHTATFDQGTGKRGPRIDVDDTTGIICWLPSQGHPTTQEPHCELFTIDLAKGYDALLTAMEVRGHRNDSKSLLAPYRPLNGGTGGEQAIGDWLRARVKALPPKAVDELRANWPVNVPRPLPAIPDGEQVATLETVLNRIEANHQVAFGALKPGTTPVPARKTINTGDNNK